MHIEVPSGQISDGAHSANGTLTPSSGRASRICPACGLINPISASKCDCSFDLAPITSTSASQEPAEATAKRAPGAVETTTYATMFQRLGAYLADLVVIYLIVFAAFFFYGFYTSFTGKAYSASDAEAYLAWFAALFIYMTVAQSAYHTTVGKYIAGLEVRSANQRERYPSFGRILVRETVGRICSSFLYGVGYWVAVKHPHKQAWSDRMAATVVVRRLTHSSLKSALTGFVFVALIADIGLTLWGFHTVERTKRHEALKRQLETVGREVEQTRNTVNEVTTRTPRDFEDFRSSMRELLAHLDRYDSAISRMKTLIDDAEREKVYASETERNDFMILQQVFDLRKEQSKKLREEANLVVEYNLSSRSWKSFESELRMLDSDIAGLDHRAAELLAKIGRK